MSGINPPSGPGRTPEPYRVARPAVRTLLVGAAVLTSLLVPACARDGERPTLRERIVERAEARLRRLRARRGTPS